jgi:tetratricopeptide (TPR) repeat protein
VDFDRPIRLKPSNALACRNREAAYLDREDYSQAIRDLEEALRLQPGFEEAAGRRP